MKRVVEGFVIAILNIQKALIPHIWMLGFLHAEDMHNRLVDHFCLPICLGVKGICFGQLGVYQRP
jgi:hypothetical protein